MPWVRCTYEHCIEMAKRPGDPGKAYVGALAYAKIHWPCVINTNTLEVEARPVAEGPEMPQILKDWSPPADWRPPSDWSR